jgi:N-acylneuraminate cytidylyltransferase
MGMNLSWAYTVDSVGRPTPVLPAAIGKRSQDLNRILVPSGAVWVGSRKEIGSAGTFYTEDYRLVPISWLEGFDIDTPDEFALAERLAQI